MSRSQEFSGAATRHLQEQIADTSWFHGTDAIHADSIATSQRADIRGIQVHGPGFYVTPDEHTAEHYARESHGTPVVQNGIPMTENPVEMTHAQLTGLGRQFRDTLPEGHGAREMKDADLGNIALRKRGHDFLHVTAGAYGDPTDVGVILRPKKWMAVEDRHLEPWS